MPRSLKCAFARSAFTLVLALVAGATLLSLTEPAAAQAFRHPFAVGAQEGAVGSVNGISAWIIGQESAFYQLLAHALDGAKNSHAALFGLLGLGFGYGVFHAAGPGHGKAVITSYMVSNERALVRGIVISALAALLQGLVAILLIGVLAIVFNATAQKMTATAHVLELAAYSGILVLGLALIWRKGTGLVATLRAIFAEWAWRTHPQLATEPSVMRAFGATPASPAAAPQRSAFRAMAADPSSAAPPVDDGCGEACRHMIDPRRFSDGFSWKSAALTVVTAGARPCSGAILVLVFALAQGIFPIGVAAVIAMAFGTAVTTAGLAITAVFGKKLAMRIAGGGGSRGAQLVSQLVEFGAALCVLLFGAALLYGACIGAISFG